MGSINAVSQSNVPIPSPTKRSLCKATKISLIVSGIIAASAIAATITAFMFPSVLFGSLAIIITLATAIFFSASLGYQQCKKTTSPLQKQSNTKLPLKKVIIQNNRFDPLQKYLEKNSKEPFIIDKNQAISIAQLHRKNKIWTLHVYPIDRQTSLPKTIDVSLVNTPPKNTGHVKFSIPQSIAIQINPRCKSCAHLISKISKLYSIQVN